MKRLVYILLVSVLALPAAPVRGQDAPRPGTLVRAWLAAQTERGRDIERVELREQAEWTIDGPFGVRRTRVLAEVTGGPGVEGWQRDPISIEADGRKIGLARWGELERQRLAMLGNNAEGIARAVLQLHKLVAQMKPGGEVLREVIDGVACWRVELVPRNNRDPVERYTLWFDRDQGHLVRSRALVRTRRRDTPFLITTDYGRFEGFDVPRRRRMEGATQMRRRLRTYTLLFQYEAAYSDYRFSRKP